MTKNDLIQAVHKTFVFDSENTLTLGQCENAVEAILQNMKNELKGKGKVTIRRFGEFTVRHKNSRIGLNPKTLEKHLVKSRDVVRFKAGMALKEAVNK